MTKEWVYHSGRPFYGAIPVLPDEDIRKSRKSRDAWVKEIKTTSTPNRFLSPKQKSVINDDSTIQEMVDLISHDGDVRVAWLGGGYAHTDVEKSTPQGVPYKNYAEWANQHWAMYYSFVDELQDPKKVLDLGCGSGFCTKNLTMLFPEAKIRAVDIDHKSVEFANKINAHENITYQTSDITSDNIGSGYDCIFFIETLEHIRHEDHWNVLDKCINALAPKGKLFITTPNETICSQGSRGHIGILAPHMFDEFTKRYRENIQLCAYLQNSELLTCDRQGASEDTSSSHYRFIMKQAAND
jgi:2-polyprenyl-3-methyl-5-hydroxy-6-metoxy-1,4-benzoquinol methylase